MDKINQIYSKPLTFGSEIEFYTLRELSPGVVELSDLRSSSTKRYATVLDSCSSSHHLNSRRVYWPHDISIETLKEALPTYNFEKERGKGQFEYHIGPYEDPKILIEKIKLSAANICDKVELLGGRAAFDPKPFANDFGNSLQIQFTSECPKFQDNIENICASFCEYALQTFLAYASTLEDYKRFDKNFMAPTHVSFGPNNRSCLIRIKDSNPKRIEIRAPSPVCNLYVMICTILQQIIVANPGVKGCHSGLNPESRKNNNDLGFAQEILDPGSRRPGMILIKEVITSCKHQKIYGLASDDQYNLTKLPETIEEAEEYFNEKFYEIT